MRALGGGLIAAGAAVGLTTTAAIATGYQIDLTPAMIHLLVYKALAAAAIGLIAAGSWVARKARQDEAADSLLAADQVLHLKDPPSTARAHVEPERVIVNVSDRPKT
jgi:hypothetical protein